MLRRILIADFAITRKIYWFYFLEKLDEADSVIHTKNNSYFQKCRV